MRQKENFTSPIHLNEETLPVEMAMIQVFYGSFPNGDGIHGRGWGMEPVETNYQSIRNHNKRKNRP